MSASRCRASWRRARPALVGLLLLSIACHRGPMPVSVIAVPTPIVEPAPARDPAPDTGVRVRHDLETARAELEEAAFAVPRATAEVRGEVEARLLEESNRLRAQEGAPPLIRDAALDRAARRFAEELARRGTLDHESEDEALRTPEARAAAEGVERRFVGETLARLAGRAEEAAGQALQLWSDSPDHRRVLLRLTYRSAGIGVAMDQKRVWYVVQMYAPAD